MIFGGVTCVVAGGIIGVGEVEGDRSERVSVGWEGAGMTVGSGSEVCSDEKSLLRSDGAPGLSNDFGSGSGSAGSGVDGTSIDAT